MGRTSLRTAAAALALGMLALGAAPSSDLRAQAPAVDPEAVKILRRTTDYLSNLKQFSMRVQNTFEDVLDSGQRVDLDSTGLILISLPNKLRIERHGDRMDQIFYYDGKTLTLHNPRDHVYATEPAPGTIEEMFAFAGESLGLEVSLSDLLYRNSFQLLMQDVTAAVVVGKAVIGGVTCDHLIFSRPGVDFQVWVADAGQPLPCKYAVTDRGTPALLTISASLSNWNVAPAVTDAQFIFTPPSGAKTIPFLKPEPGR